MLAERFQAPLSANGMSISVPSLVKEWRDMVEYAIKFYKPLTWGYKKTWKRIFTCAKKDDFRNILMIVELCFCMPVSAAVVERCFSTLRRIKSSKRASLKTDTLSQLIRISVESVQTEKFDVGPALQNWTNKVVRRPQHIIAVGGA